MPLYSSLTIATLVLLIDQVTKWLALTHLQLGIPQPVLPFLNWLLLFNPGAAFSFLAQGSGWQRWFFTLLGLAACAYIVYLLARTQLNKTMAWALSLILGGGLR